MAYKKIVWTLVIVLAVAGIFVFLRRRGYAGTLVVGTNAGFRPYEFFDKKGKLAGFDIDMARAIGDKLSMRIEFKEMPFDDLIPELKEGRVDMIMAGMSITPERKEMMFMVPYGTQAMSTFPLVFWGTVTRDNIQSLKDVKKLGSHPISAIKGSIQEKMLKEVAKANVRPHSHVDGLIIDIKQGKSIACLLEDSVVRELRKKYPELRVINVQIPKNYISWGNGIAIAKEREDLFRKVLDVVNGLKKDKTAQKLYKKWFV